MSDPPRLRDLSTPGGDFSRSLLRDAAPTKPLTAVDALRLKGVVAKAGAAHASGWFAVSVVPKALAAVTLVALGGGAIVAAAHRAPVVAQASAHPRPRASPRPRRPRRSPSQKAFRANPPHSVAPSRARREPRRRRGPERARARPRGEAEGDGRARRGARSARACALAHR
ncbi:MAG: hypothetical protein U0326_30855 [Polyangiales bacterium]